LWRKMFYGFYSNKELQIKFHRLNLKLKQTISKRTFSFFYVDPPKNLVVTHNITVGTLYDKGHVNVSCQASANPPANYTIKEGSDTLYTGLNSSYVVYINQFHHKRQLSYICIADNGIGPPVISSPIGLRVQNGK